MATPDPALLKGRGLLYVQSRIARDDVLDESTFFKWYDEDHIDEIVHTSGIESAFRYKDLDFETKVKRKEKGLLAVYPLQDLAFLLSDEFRGIRVKSDMLPDTGIVYDLAEFDVRYLGLVDKTDRELQTTEPAACLVCFGVEPPAGVSDKVVERWFKEEHVPAASKLKGYIRTTTYHLKYARTNAQSRALKGLPTTDAPSPEPPTWLALHEFHEVTHFPPELEKTLNAQEIVGDAKQVERVVYRLVKGLGNEKFFD